MLHDFEAELSDLTESISQGQQELDHKSCNRSNGGDTIVIYHCNISIVSRGKGKSAIAAAAYRSGEKITNEWDGITHDYTGEGGVYTEIMPPPMPRSLSLTVLPYGTAWSFTRKPGTRSLPEGLTQHSP